MRIRFSFLSVAVSLLAMPAFAQVTPPVMPMGVPAKPQSRIFEVGDLIKPDPAIPTTRNATHAHLLVKMIAGYVKPESWEIEGGAGKIEYIAASDSLCVTNTPDVLADVAKLIVALRSLQDRVVVVKVSDFTVPVGFGAKAGWLRKGKPSTHIWTPDEVNAAQELLMKQKALTVVYAPTLMLYDGQRGSVMVGQNPPVTQLGLKFDCSTIISKDGKSIQLEMRTSRTIPGREGKATESKSSATAMVPIGDSAMFFHGNATDTEQEVYQIVTMQILKQGEAR